MVNPCIWDTHIWKKNLNISQCTCILDVGWMGSWMNPNKVVGNAWTWQGYAWGGAHHRAEMRQPSLLFGSWALRKSRAGGQWDTRVKVKVNTHPRHTPILVSVEAVQPLAVRAATFQKLSWPSQGKLLAAAILCVVNYSLPLCLPEGSAENTRSTEKTDSVTNHYGEYYLYPSAGVKAKKMEMKLLIPFIIWRIKRGRGHLKK